jgi:hypothetical protein
MPCGAWPEFYILGVQKGATTSLAGALSHAGVNHADKKSGSSCCNRHGWRHCVRLPIELRRRVQRLPESLCKPCDTSRAPAKFVRSAPRCAGARDPLF